MEDKNILKANYDKVKVIPGTSVLYDYLERRPVPVQGNHARTILYPFGFNLSQKAAVENAMRSKVSLIEGPPGTGKTQMILNILANAVMNGETVAVVSNNNTATENVYEKLQKYGLSFIAAQLGNWENRERFLMNQQVEIPNVQGWNMEQESFTDLERKLAASEAELDRMLEAKNRMAVLNAELDELKRESQHYTSSAPVQNDETADAIFSRMRRAFCCGSITAVTRRSSGSATNASTTIS